MTYSRQKVLDVNCGNDLPRNSGAQLQFKLFHAPTLNYDT